MLDPTDGRTWMAFADRSYVATRLLWFTGLTIDSAVQVHRTMELYLKAFLVSNGVPVKPGAAWGHNLGELGALCGQTQPSFSNADILRRLRFLDRYFDYVRYPSEPGSPTDGSLVWFSFESNILLLDQLVAYVRPRIELTNQEWKESELTQIEASGNGYLHRALSDGNEYLQLILCEESNNTNVKLDEFRFDQEGC